MCSIAGRECNLYTQLYNQILCVGRVIAENHVSDFGVPLDFMVSTPSSRLLQLEVFQYNISIYGSFVARDPRWVT